MEPLRSIEHRIVEVGLFVVFLVLFGRYVFGEVWPTVGPIVAAACQFVRGLLRAR